MELYEAINSRRTVREFLDKEVDFEAIKRIIEAGNKAPTWNHNRNWSYIVLRTDEEKEFAFDYAKKIADKFDADTYLNRPKPYPTTLAQKMYAHAMPRQFTMLKDAPYVVIPVFKCKELNGEYVSKLNPFSTIWCVIENIFLAATAEGLSCSMRIPLNEEHDVVKKKLKVPPTYMIPVFIGVGYADPDEHILEQNVADLEKQIHFGNGDNRISHPPFGLTNPSGGFILKESLKTTHDNTYANPLLKNANPLLKNANPKIKMQTPDTRFASTL